MKSIGGNGGRRDEVRDESAIFRGLFAPDPERGIRGRSLFAAGFPEDDWLGDFASGWLRGGFRPAKNCQ